MHSIASQQTMSTLRKYKMAACHKGSRTCRVEPQYHRVKRRHGPRLRRVLPVQSFESCATRSCNMPDPNKAPQRSNCTFLETWATHCNSEADQAGRENRLWTVRAGRANETHITNARCVAVICLTCHNPRRNLQRRFCNGWSRRFYALLPLT